MDIVRQIINFLANCFRCKEDAVHQNSETNERTHLLQNPINSSPTVIANNGDLSRDNQNSVPQKSESNALNRIVQDFATNIIDVGAMDSHNLEPQELNDRIRMYSNKLAQQWGSLQEDSAFAEKGILEDVKPDDAQRLLSAAPITEADLKLIRSFTHKSYVALNEIRVEHREDLVVPFRIP